MFRTSRALRPQSNGDSISSSSERTDILFSFSRFQSPPPLSSLSSPALGLPSSLCNLVDLRREAVEISGGDCKATIMTNGTVKDAFISINMEENENIFSSYPVEAGRHVSFLTGFEDEVMGAEQSFLEHDCDNDLVGSHLGFGTFNSRKCFSVENLSCEYDEIIDGDVVDSTLNMGEETKKEFFYGILEETDDLLSEQKALPLTSKHSSIGRDVTHDPCEDSRVGQKVGSENNSRVESGASSLDISFENAEGNMNSSTAVFDLMSVKELQDTFKSVFGRETIVVDKQWLKRRIVFGMQNNKLNRDLTFRVCDMTSREIEAKIGLTSSSAKMLSYNTWGALDGEGMEDDCKPQGRVDEAGAVVTGKRTHRPPKRFIDESLEPKSKIKRRRSAFSHNSYKTSKIKLLEAKPQKQLLSSKESEESQSLCSEEPFDGACIQVPFGLPVEEEQLEEKTCSTTSIVPFVLWHDSDNSPGSIQSTISNERSDPDCASTKLMIEYAPTDDFELNPSIIQKGIRRRKHHIAWTESEVLKLIDGIAHLGVGRWSKIKRLLFSSSKHRTSVDLKDKWRNLVKASNCIQLKKKRKGLQVRKPLSHQAPEPVLRRVRELANHYSLC